MPNACHLNLALAACVGLSLGCATRPEAPPESTTLSAPRPSPPQPASSAPRVITLAAKEAPPTHLAVFLHGVGADAASFARVAHALAPSLTRAESLVVDGLEPFDRAPHGRQWFSLASLAEDDVKSRLDKGARATSTWIDGALQERGIAGDKLVLVGFSQGAMVAGWLAVNRVPRPAAVVMLSGMLAFADGPAIAGSPTPVLLTHGERDQVISVSRLEPAAALLSARGAKPTMKTYPGLAHHIDERVLEDARNFLTTALQ